MSDSTWLVVGLGNPGPTYAMTRHNVGFFVADEIARRGRVSFSAPKGMHAEVAETRIGPAGVGVPGPGSVKVVVAKPRTFMNDSGRAIRALAAFHKVDPAHVVTIHDELDIDAGKLRIKFGGGDNGHNGLKSTRAHLSTGDFFRVRFGIGRPPGRQNPVDYVLATIPMALREDIAIETARAADAIETLIVHGLETAQNQFNS